MYGTYLAMNTVDDRLIDLSLAKPALVIAVDNRKINTPIDQRAEDIGLRQGLSILLTYPFRWSVGRDEDDRQLLIVSLRYGRMQIEQSRTRGDAYGNRANMGRRNIAQSQADGIEASTALIRHGIAGDARYLIEVMDDRSVSASRANDDSSTTMTFQYTGQNIDILDIAKHGD